MTAAEEVDSEPVVRITLLEVVLLCEVVVFANTTEDVFLNC